MEHCQALQTHSYDGGLDLELLPELLSTYLLPLEVKRARGQELLLAFEHYHGSSEQDILQSVEFLKEMIMDLGTAANVDVTNFIIRDGTIIYLSADDLLALCWFQRGNTAFLDELTFQLLDMATGFCPQGRTHRLFQLLLTCETQF